MNIKKFYVYWIFKDLMPIYPLYLLMFERNGLSIAQISLLLAIWSIPAVLLEIPTGILADRWSRKNLIVLGGLLKAFCYLIWMIPGNITVYAAGFLLWGIAGALRSGSEEALLYDTLKVLGKEDRFDLVLGRGQFLSGVSNILASVTGGFIGSLFGFRAALAISVCTALISSGIALTMKEVNLYKRHYEDVQNLEEKATLRKSLAFLFGSKEVLLCMLLALLVITTAGVLDEYDQLIAEGYGLSIGSIGIWTAIRFILIAVGGLAARGLKAVIEKLFRWKERIYTISMLCILAAVFLAAAGLIRQLAVMVLYGLYYLLISAGEVLEEDYIQQRIEQEGRSTVHSLAALAQNLYGIICYGLFGLAISITGLQVGLVWCGTYIALCTAIISIIYRNRNNYLIRRRKSDGKKI